MTKPYSIRIFLPDGDPDGVRTIEKSNWTGVGIVIPRALMSGSKQRRELSRTGVYVLFGPAEDSGILRIYVGEGDPIRPRLEQHSAKKDFWTTCVAFTSKDDNLNKAHVQFLESKLIGLASSAKRCVLDNGNAPALPSLSESDFADADGFLSEMLLCFPLLGLSVFTKPQVSPAGSIKLFVSAKGVNANGAETAEGFVVNSGSGAVGEEVASCPPYIRQLRSTLIANKVLIPTGVHYIFSQPYVFSSASTASGVVQGRSSNGRAEWATSAGKTLKELQDAAL